MNPVQKGNRNERKSYKYYTSQGIPDKCIHTAKRTRMGGNDIFCWDMIVLVGRMKYWVQVKTNKKPCLTPYVAWKNMYANEYDRCFVHVWVDRKGLTIIEV